MAGQDTSTVAPRLIRAIAEATQPFGPFLSGSALHILEVDNVQLNLQTLPNNPKHQWYLLQYQQDNRRYGCTILLMLIRIYYKDAYEAHH